MVDVDQAKEAKALIDKLAAGVHPATGELLRSDSVLNDVTVLRGLFNVSDVLRQVIENPAGASSGRGRTRGRAVFALPTGATSRLTPSSSPLQVTQFVERVNELVDHEQYRKLPTTAVTNWLVEKGLLAEETFNGKTKKRPTAAGERIGISSVERSGQYGVYHATLYDRNAQQFLIDNLPAIVEEYQAKRTRGRAQTRTNSQSAYSPPSWGAQSATPPF